MKKIIRLLLISIMFTSCRGFLGTGVFVCEVDGNINDIVSIYPVKQQSRKKIKKFTIYQIAVERKIDSMIWDKVWIDVDLKPINGEVLYGQLNKARKQPILLAKELKNKSTYKVNFNLSSYWLGYGICSCRFKIDEKGNAIHIQP